MFSFFRRFFKKNPKRGNATYSLTDITAMKETWETHVTNWDNSVKLINNPLVDNTTMQSKLNELRTSAERLQFFLGQYETHLRCLHNWLTTPPPGPKVEVKYETEPKIADSDQEYLDKLKAAQEHIRQRVSGELDDN